MIENRLRHLKLHFSSSIPNLSISYNEVIAIVNNNNKSLQSMFNLESNIDSTNNFYSF